MTDGDKVVANKATTLITIVERLIGQALGLKRAKLNRNLKNEKRNEIFMDRCRAIEDNPP